MNSRIELASADSVSIRHHSKDAGVTTLRVNAGGDSIHRNAAGSDYWDAEGRAALRDCLNCFDTHGTFAPLADTDSRPFVGKRMRGPWGDSTIEVVLAGKNFDAWYGYVGTPARMQLFKESVLLPLTPAPPKRVRAYTPVEMGAHVRRNFRWDGWSIESGRQIEGVYWVGCYDDAKQFWTYEKLASECTWADSGEPCGIIEEAT